MFNLFKTYNKAKDVFVKPKIVVNFGLWKNMSCLPMWRRGNILKIGNYNQFYFPKNSVHIKKYDIGEIKEDGTVAKYTEYENSTHKLPENAICGVWRRDIRKKLRRFGLGWLKPQYILPTWLSFFVFDWDVMYKWKFDSIRYEFPPQFTIIIFGIALNITLKPILEDENDCDDHYWESLLSFLYQKECNRCIEDTLIFCGCWKRYLENDKTIEFFQLRKSHIKPEYHDEYDMAVLKYNEFKEKEYDSN